MDTSVKPCARRVLAFLIVLLTLCSLGICQQECDTPLELGFLVDRSGSISRRNFDKVKSFILTVIAGFDVSKEGTHIGIISYSSAAKTVISFNQFDNPNFDYSKLNQTIRDGLAYPEGGVTRIDLALEKADKELFSDTTKYRSYVPKILLILTDGQQTREDGMDVDLSEATKKLSRKGVEVFVLGVGDSVNIPEMLEIAADKDENVYLADNFDELEMVVEGLVNSFCKVCRRDLDIVFLIPTVSKSLQDVKAIVNAMLLTFGIRKYKGVHIGIITCAEQGEIVLRLNEQYMKTDIQNTLKSLEMTGSSVILDKCLKEASTKMFDVTGGVRNVVDKYLIVFEDGGSSFYLPAVNDALSTLKSQDVTVLGMSVGSEPSAETKMKTISHNPKSVWFKQIRNREIQNAAFFARSMSEILCKEKPGKCPYVKESETCEDEEYVDECALDSDRAGPCPGDTICCESACGRRCVSPMPDCFSPVEIALLVDSSGTQRDRYKEDILEKFKKFSKELLHSFSITESAARVAIVTYSDEAKMYMDLGSGQHFKTVERSIDDIKLSNKPDRDLEEALRFSKENVFSMKGGLRKVGGRVLVVLSSGQQTNEEKSLSSAAQSLKDQGVEIWAVHAGEDTASYLNEVVSHSSNLSPSLPDDLKDFQKNFVMRVCAAKAGVCRSPVCSSTGENQCKQDYVCPGQEKCCPGICRGCVEPKTDCRYPMDVAFIVQNSMTKSAFNKVKSFLKSIMDDLEVGRTQTYIGVITFNKRAKIDLEFTASLVSDPLRKRQVLFDAIDKIEASLDRSTDGAAEAFQLAKNRLLTREAGSHPNEIRNVIFISNGNFDQPVDVAESAKNLRPDVSNIFPFAVTNDIDVDTLEKIAIPDGEKNIYLTTSYEALYQYGNKIAVDMCRRGVPQPASKNFLVARRTRDLAPDSGAKFSNEKIPVVLIRGPPGSRGLPGNEGGRGEPGPEGAKGPPGHFGPPGEPGIVGEPGSPGTIGMYGPVGSPGAIVIERGERKGPWIDQSVIRSAEYNFSSIIASEVEKGGVPGARGPKGIKGLQGPRGGQGNLGRIGKSGLCGGEGAIGATGEIGIPGRQGSRGIPGDSGERGIRGEKGEMGDSGSKGSKGEKGPLGDIGVKGEKGDDGQIGDSGEPGFMGEQGPRGKTGPRGEVGIEGEEGFKGFRGAQGDPGQRGAPGLQGERGPPGPVGFRGLPGPPGIRGPIGFYGSIGEPGAVGDVGSNGVKGKRGAYGKRGEDGPPGKHGELGDVGGKGGLGRFGPQGERGEVGEKGEDAENGEMGDPGPDGSDGSQGDRGMMGDKGQAGLDAPSGMVGKTGSQGDAGQQGSRGPDGPPGPKGEMGPDGRPGPPGHTSSPGYVGAPGDDGEKGERGDAGHAGQRGRAGQKGYPGEPGLIGFPGTTGPPGRPGMDGLYGPHGTIGDPGLTGLPGLRGPRGQQGRPGQDGEPGPRGNIGLKGFPGPPGFPGQPGVAAPPGPNGYPGEPGDSGTPGRPGSYGFAGRIGEDGLAGDKGRRGSPGNPGKAGKPAKSGLQGSQGPPGDKGSAGRQGEVGSRGPRGLPGPKGLPGRPGDSGGRGREGDRGPRGPAGPPGQGGSKGERGRQGKPGKMGQNGSPGKNGLQGETGSDGQPGDKGATGDPGKPGRAGEPGRDGLPGVQGPVGDLGPTGLLGETGTIGLPGFDGTPGPKGPEGDAGKPGDSGGRGVPGFPGPPGSMGPRGERGQKGTAGTGTLPGEPGSRGPEGFQGTLGSAGTPGKPGEKGEMGVKGLPGDEGDQGEKGSRGKIGDVGEAGAKGAKGTIGDVGDKGDSGEQGINGEPGPPGKIGGAGEPGLDGRPGLSPTAGIDGEKGDPGKQGTNGADGKPGKQGLNGTEGAIGAKGDSFVRGPKGIEGDPGKPGLSVDGNVGPPGPPGPPGDDGLPGLKGEKGATGPTGPKGSGVRGENGTVGVPGKLGKSGSKGVKGDIGRAGVNATKGEKGNKGKVGLPGPGEKGDNGTAGPPGADGIRGPPGPTVNGSRGEVGSRGPKGVQGSRGPPGPPGQTGPHAVSFNGTTISIRYNASYTEYIATDLDSNISTRYFNIHRDLGLYRRPNGSQLFPAISCAGLFSYYPGIANDWYWIDPNQGSYEDAEKVYCDFENNATCLEPVRSKIENKKWFSGEDGYRWFTEEVDAPQIADKFNYTFDDGQLQMLQLHSSRAWQRIIYRCLNSVPWGNSTQQENSIKLQGDDDFEFHNRMPRKLRPVIIEDNCQTKDETWRETILEVKARDPANLPIRDIAVYDVGDDGEEFGLELGEVCFAP